MKRRAAQIRRIIIYLLMLACLYPITQADFFININPLWTHTGTTHFIIRYPRGSPAADGIMDLAAQLEGYYAELTKIFPLPEHEPIPVYYHNRQLFAGLNPVWGYTTDYSVHATYSHRIKDTSPHELRHFIQDMINPDAPYFFNEGACGIGIRIGGIGFDSRARASCPDLQRITLESLVHDYRMHADRRQDYWAYSFAAFLTGTFGKKTFGRFYARATPADWREVFAEEFGIPPGQAEAAWKAALCAKIPLQ
ncbi:MAG: hypothetical protein KC897_04850 [Candidatus Omnitrophica bacterium]|nr:hypothetical protein [Candidatus Omnitrophota bacterium]MCB9720030.1 hypothetical protein [Candidatus Omnitrophota bacterium]